MSIEKETKRISLSYKATQKNPWEEIHKKLGEKVKVKIKNITDKAIFAEILDSTLPGMLHFKEISYQENVQRRQFELG